MIWGRGCRYEVVVLAPAAVGGTVVYFSFIFRWNGSHVYVAVCRVNRGKVKLDALLPEGHTRAWQCKDVPLICQRLHVDLLDTGYPVG